MAKHRADGPATGPAPLTEGERKLWWAINHPLPVVDTSNANPDVTFDELFGDMFRDRVNPDGSGVRWHTTVPGTGA